MRGFKRGGGLRGRMETRVTVTHTGKGFAVDARTAKGLEMRIDGDGNLGASPMEHLLASVGACALMDVDLILRKKRLAFSDLRCECVGARPDSGDVKPFLGMRLVFRVSGDVPKKAFDDAVRLSVEKYCSVRETLRGDPSVAFDAVVDA